MKEQGEMLSDSQSIVLKPSEELSVYTLSNDFYVQVILSNPDGIIASDMKGRILLFNPAAETILGYTQADALAGMKVSDMYPPKAAREVMKKIKGSEFGGVGKLVRQRVIAVTKSGQQIPLSLSACTIYEGNQPIAIVGIFRDISRVEQMERQLEDARAQLFKAEKMASLGKLAAGIAHEINNPLSGILIYASLVMDSFEASDERRDDLHLVIQEAMKCQEIVHDMLEFAHQTPFEITSFDLNTVIETGMRLLIKKSLFGNIHVYKDLKPDLPLIFGDPSRIRQVVINLVINAIDAMMGRGTLTIKTGLRGKGQIVEIEITDTGPGIPEDILPKIFDPFFTTKDVRKGTGLGLAVTYSIVRAHNGNIRVKTTEGQGTTFFIDLPVSDQSIAMPGEGGTQNDSG